MNAETTRELERTLRSINNLLKHGSRHVLAECGLTPPQFFTLLTIMHHDGLSMSELCDRMFLSPATMTGIVDRLEAKQFVERTRDCSDRRVVRLRITTQGKEILHQAYRSRIALLDTALQGLTCEQQQLLAQLLGDVRQALSKAVEKERTSSGEE